MKNLKLSQQDAARELLARRKARASLIAYSKYQWPGYRDAGHHRLIAEHLEKVERGEIKRLMITMPPRHGKSMLASEFFPSWYIGRNPNNYIVTATYAQELADDFGRKVKNYIDDPAFRATFPGIGLAGDSKSSKRFHIDGNIGGIEHTTQQRGAFYAVGVGGPLTGRGAHLLLIDDPIKNREDAESEIIRKKIKDWYTSTAYTRLMPNGCIVVIQCMVGDTPVLMEGGDEKYLRDIKVGDRVATYKDGSISCSTVMNWASQGYDNVFTIRMSSGISVRANERHPFLVDRNGVREWVRLKNLMIGDKAFRVIGANGEEFSAITRDARSQQRRVGSVCPTITKTSGPEATMPHLSTPFPDVQHTSSTDTASQSKNTRLLSLSRTVSAQYVGSLQGPMLERTGVVSSALTTATTRSKSEACCATIATLQSDTGKHTKLSSERQITYEIIPDEIEDISYYGYEEVFDIQVEDTENFIANGVVSHNTRWHEDDLAGWLQTEHAHEGWVVLDLPAINDKGEALWPEQYPIESLEQIKRALPPRDWSALYQQRPSPETGDYFKREWIRTVDVMPARETMSIYGASDYAVTSNGGDYTVHVIVGVDHEGRLWLLDLWRSQSSSDVWVDAFCDLVRKWKPIGWAEETGQIKSGVGPFLVKRMMDTGAYVAREQFATRGDKSVRAQSIRGRMALSGMYVHSGAPFLSDLVSEMMSFPVGVHDDQVDALGLAGQLMDRMSSGSKPKQQERQLEVGAVYAPALPNRRR